MTAPASVREAILARCARGMSYRAISRELAASLGREGSPGADVPSAGISGPSTPIGVLRASYGPAAGRPQQEQAHGA